MADFLWLLQSAVVVHCLAYFVQDFGISIENSYWAASKKYKFRLPMRSMSTNPGHLSVQGRFVFVFVFTYNYLTIAVSDSEVADHYLESITYHTMLHCSPFLPCGVCLMSYTHGQHLWWHHTRICRRGKRALCED